MQGRDPHALTISCLQERVIFNAQRKSDKELTADHQARAGTKIIQRAIQPAVVDSESGFRMAEEVQSVDSAYGHLRRKQ